MIGFDGSHDSATAIARAGELLSCPRRAGGPYLDRPVPTASPLRPRRYARNDRGGSKGGRCSRPRARGSTCSRGGPARNSSWLRSAVADTPRAGQPLAIAQPSCDRGRLSRRGGGRARPVTGGVDAARERFAGLGQSSTRTGSDRPGRCIGTDRRPDRVSPSTARRMPSEPSTWAAPYSHLDRRSWPTSGNLGWCVRLPTCQASAGPCSGWPRSWTRSQSSRRPRSLRRVPLALSATGSHAGSRAFRPKGRSGAGYSTWRKKTRRAAIVVGCRGLTGISAALGSVSQGVVHHSERPVLLVPTSPSTGPTPHHVADS